MIKKIVSIFVILMMGMTLSGCELIGSSAGPYQISYDSNGGSALETVEVDANQTFLPSQVPTKEGYVFSGWYLDPNFLYPIAFNAGVTQSLTLYAKWEEESNPLSETEIRDIIDAILLEQDLILTDEVTITNIVNALVEDGTLVDEAAIVSAVLSNIDVVALMEEHVTSMLA
ncbi:MAG: InlB B-repeat-containing protein, partial [Bacillota bacterium]